MTCRAFTLIEMVVALAIVSVLLVAMGSAVLLASRALPGNDGAVEVRQHARVAVNDLTGLLFEATAVTEKTDRSIEFVTADLNADAAADTLRFAWSGTPGHPLTRTINGGTPVTVVDGVQEFTLLYTIRSESPTDVDPPAIEGAEQLFLQQDSSNSGAGSGVSIGSSRSAGQFFQPVLSPDAVSWRITRLTFLASTKNPKDGEAVVEVQRPSAGGGPGGGVVDGVTVLESNLGNNSWYEVQFPAAGGLSPDDGGVIVLRYGNGTGTVVSAKSGTGSYGSPGTTYWEDTGAGWQEIGGQDLWLWIWGTESIPDPNWTPPPNKYYLRNVGLRLQVGSEPATAIETEVQVLNEPEVTGL